MLSKSKKNICFSCKKQVIKKYGKSYCLDCARDKGRKRYYSATPEDIETRKILQRRHYKKNKEEIKKRRNERYAKSFKKEQCRSILFRAIQRGEVKRLPCEICGVGNAEAHHNDYTKPFNVIFLCRKHHSRLHAEYGEKLVLSKKLKIKMNESIK